MSDFNILPGLNFSLTLEQEEKLNEWLDEQNKVIVEEQLKSDEFTEVQKEIQRKTLETNSPLPIYDLNVGYYSISFTPVAWGNRIYVHNHFTGKSFKLFDYEDFQKQSESVLDAVNESAEL